MQGSKNIVADALSRLDIVDINNSISLLRHHEQNIFF